MINRFVFHLGLALVVSIVWSTVCQSLSVATESSIPVWSIPMAGNAFRSSTVDGSDGSDGIRRNGDLGFRDKDEVYSLYFHADRSCTVELAVEAKIAKGQATLVTRVGEQTFRAKVGSSDFETVSLSQVQLTSSGYTRLDLQCEESSEGGFPQLSNLVVKSSTPDLKLSYVSTNEGAMYYWGRRGPSVHLAYDTPKDKNIQFAYSEITVPEKFDPIGSYFMANGFAQGYFGIQVNSDKERRVLFSVWSPFKTDNPKDIPQDQRIELLAKGAKVHVGKFGNEGSGGQSYLVYPWQAGKTYRFLTEVKPVGDGKTIYTSWFSEASTEQWQLIASFQRPKTDTYLKRFHCFLENFAPAYGHLQRKANYGNTWVIDESGQWHECVAARFTVDATGGQGYRLDYACGVDGSHFLLRNGGFFDETGKPGETIERKSSRHPEVQFDQLPRR